MWLLWHGRNETIGGLALLICDLRSILRAQAEHAHGWWCSKKGSLLQRDPQFALWLFGLPQKWQQVTLRWPSTGRSQRTEPCRFVR